MSPVKYRPRRGTLSRSLAETVEVGSREELLAVVRRQTQPLDGAELGTLDDLAIFYEGHPRAEWDTYEVWFLGTLVGFASGALGGGGGA